MVFLTIETIVDMFKTFAKDVKPPLQPKEEPRDMTIDLNSEAPLPEGWEQRLDIETRERIHKYFEKPNIAEPNSNNESDNKKSCGSGTQSFNSVVTNVRTNRDWVRCFVVIRCTRCFRYVMTTKSKKCPMWNCDKLIRFDEGGRA